MPIGDRIRARRGRGRRVVRWGEQFDSDELDDIELELPSPSREPGDESEEAEPWGTDKFPDRERAYREFLEQYERQHPNPPEQRIPDGPEGER